MGQDIPEKERDNVEDPELLKEALTEARKRAKEGDGEANLEEEETEARLKEIKIHGEALSKDESPLTQISRKELELKGDLLEAQKNAEGIIAEARRKAATIRAAADEIAVAEAKKFSAVEREKAQKEAEKIRSSVGEDMNQIKAVGEKSIDKAVKIILKEVTRIE